MRRAFVVLVLLAMMVGLKALQTQADDGSDPMTLAAIGFVVQALVLLASHLGMVTVAEGVETEGQARLLAELGCDRGQGWLFARAMPFEAPVAFCDDYSPVERCTPRPLSTSFAPSMMRASSSATVGRSSIAPTT